MNLSVLKSFGINQNDIKIYKALFDLGVSKTGNIIKSTNIASSRVYESLRNLVDKGLVSYQVKNNIKYYTAEKPTQIIEDAKHKVTELEKLEQFIKTSPLTHLGRNEVNIYEGKHGFRMAFAQQAENLVQGETISIISFSYRAGLESELRTFLATIEKNMAAKKCRSMMLRDKFPSTLLKAGKFSKSLHEIRYLPAGYFGPTAVNISKKEVLLSIWGESPLVFSIKNPLIVKSFKKNFEFLWELAKKE